MQPSENSSDDNVSVSPILPRKRDISGQQIKTTSSTTARQPSHVPAPIGSGQGSASAASKRLKTSHSPGNLRKQPEMSKSVGMISRPGVVDLTRPSNFQPHTGAKRLVIKNLRTTSRKDIDEYYERTWADLDAALTSNFNREQPATPLEVLCRGVEAICRRGRAEQLATHVKERSKAYLEKQLRPMIEKEAGSSNVDTLRTVYKYWTIWNEQSVSLCIRSLPGTITNPFSDNYALHLLLPRSIIPPYLERLPPIRRPRNRAISTYSFPKEQSKGRQIIGFTGGGRHV